MRLLRAQGLAVAAMAFTVVAAGYAQDGAAETYKRTCQVCHGPNGAGDTPMGKKLEIKDFHAPEVAKMPDAELFDIIKKGKGKMPPFEGRLKDSEIKDLVKYIRTLKK